MFRRAVPPFRRRTMEKNRQKKNLGQPRGTLKELLFRAPHFQSSARRIDIHFVSLIFFDPPDGPLRKKKGLLVVWVGCVCVFLNSMMHYLVSRSKRTLPAVLEKICTLFSCVCNSFLGTSFLSLYM